MKNGICILIILTLIACSGTKNKERPIEWNGKWHAAWSTPPSAYPDVEDMQFTMTGQFEFTSDSLTITNYGYPGCIFASDTLSHTQLWRISNDSLHTYNDPAFPGMSYQVQQFSTDKVELQLLEDIHVTLTK